MLLPATVRLFLVMEPFVQPLIVSPEGFRKAEWPGRRLKLRVRQLSGPSLANYIGPTCQTTEHMVNS